MDIQIEKVVNIYYYETDQWRRDFFAPRIHDGIILFTAGQIEYTLPDKKLKAQRGDILFLPGNVPYSGKKLCETVGFYVIDFACKTADEFDKNIHAAVVPVADYNAAEVKFQTALDAWIRQPIDRNFKIKSVMYWALCHAAGAEKKSPSLTEAILDYIYEHISDPSLSVKQLCAQFYISESQLRRNILFQTGMKPNEYITNIRLNMAKNELICTAKSIGAIAESCGFSSAYYFSNCFSRIIGMSPTQYRKYS